MAEFIQWSLLALLVLGVVGVGFLETWLVAYDEGYKEGLARGKRNRPI